MKVEAGAICLYLKFALLGTNSSHLKMDGSVKFEASAISFPPESLTVPPLKSYNPSRKGRKFQPSFSGFQTRC